MTNVVNTNINAMIGLNQLRITGLGMQTTLERLSSGLKINRPSDNPNGLAIAKTTEAQLGGIRTAVTNAEDAKSLIAVADGALNETTNILLRMRDLAVRAANQATLTSGDVQKINSEMQSLKAEITRKATAVTFNSKVLFSGGFSGGQVVQIGPDNSLDFLLTVTIGPMTLSGLALATNGMNSVNSLWISNISTGTTAVSLARAAIDYINTAINNISNTRSALGIQERRLDFVINDLKTMDINISAAKSQIMDADMAAEISEFTRLQILQQTGTAMLAQANAQPQSILQLMK
jgi:flagellin